MISVRVSIEEVCLVQDKHRRQAEHYARNAEQLLLTLGKASAVLADDRVVSRGILLMKLCAWEALAAAITSSSVASGLPMTILSRIVPDFSQVS